MIIYRGPKEKEFADDAHQPVDIIKSEELEESVKSGNRLKFNITKHGSERKAICHVFFEDDDVVSIVNGAISKLKNQQKELKKIKGIVYNYDINNDEKIALIKEIL